MRKMDEVYENAQKKRKAREKRFQEWLSGIYNQPLPTHPAESPEDDEDSNERNNVLPDGREWESDD